MIISINQKKPIVWNFTVDELHGDERIFISEKEESRLVFITAQSFERMDILLQHTKKYISSRSFGEDLCNIDIESVLSV